MPWCYSNLLEEKKGFSKLSQKIPTIIALVLTMASSVKNPWIELRNDMLVTGALGTYEHRYIVFKMWPHAGFVHDMHTKTLVHIPNPPHPEDLRRYSRCDIVVNGVLYQLLPNYPMRRISLSPMSKWEETRTILGPTPDIIVSSGSTIFFITIRKCTAMIR